MPLIATDDAPLSFRRLRRSNTTESGYQKRKMTTLKDEFRSRNFLLHHSDPSLFYTSQWRIPRLFFVIYRVLTAVYCIAWLLIFSIVFPSGDIPYPFWAFLTNWSFFILTSHATLAAVIACIHNAEDYYDSRVVPSENAPLLGQNSESDLASSTHSLYADSTLDHIFVRVSPMPWYMKFDWVLYNVSAFACLFVTIVFFTFLFPYMNQGLDLLNFIVHGTNTILTLIELCLCAVPIRLLHFVYPVVYALLYIVFSIVYWAYDHSRVMYPILNWNDLNLTLPFLVGGLVGGIVLWILMFFVARFRKYIFIRFTVD